MQGSKAESALNEFIASVDELGASRTASALREERKKNFFQNNEDVQFILSIISKSFKIPIKEITDGVGRKNDRHFAIGFCVYYLNTVFGHDIDLVAYMLKKSTTICYKYSRHVEALSSTSKPDKKYIDRKKRLDLKLEKTKIDGLVQKRMQATKTIIP